MLVSKRRLAPLCGPKHSLGNVECALRTNLYALRIGFWLAVLLFVWGCAGEPPRRPPALPMPPPPPAMLGPQEAALDRAIQEFYGASYKSGGTTPAGVDCSGLVQTAFLRAGVALPRTVAQQFREGQSVAVSEMRFGDVVFFNRFCQIKRYNVFTAGIVNPALADEVCHNGIYVGQGRFVHASPKGVFVSRLDAEVWRVSYMGARRYLPY
ncbi:MAG: NlpC/P60 family protein [Deltaproteobacteria bacterium]|nr:NlpC/P60 family protein [Deltaproteobacteria bacterium]